MTSDQTRVAAALFGFVFLGVALALMGTAHAASATEALDALVAAYPQMLARHDGERIYWRDGTLMLASDGKAEKSFDQLLKDASILDQFHLPYRRGRLPAPPAPNEDPGRFRNEAFFRKMYGDCHKGEIERRLVTIIAATGTAFCSRAAERCSASRRLRYPNRTQDQDRPHYGGSRYDAPIQSSAPQEGSGQSSGTAVLADRSPGPSRHAWPLAFSARRSVAGSTPIIRAVTARPLPSASSRCAMSSFSGVRVRGLPTRFPRRRAARIPAFFVRGSTRARTRRRQRTRRGSTAPPGASCRWLRTRRSAFLRLTPRLFKSSTMLISSDMDRPSRSSFQTWSTSPDWQAARASIRPGRCAAAHDNRSS